MVARTAAEFLDGLRDNREVWLHGKPVEDVTTHPDLAASARGIAGYFDYQHDFADECLVTDEASGDTINASHIIPRSIDDLRTRRRCIQRLARYHVGMLGRTPDYLNVTFAGFAGQRSLWARDGNEQGAANLVEFQRRLALEDIALTHTIIHPTVDKSVPDIDAGGGEVVLHKVGETADGIVVRGARVLATLAPFSDEIAVYPGHPLPRGADAKYALSFSIPNDTPGLRFLCRDSVAVDAATFDRPFSSRFDEQDAFVIFDDVEVPAERVFLDGQVEVYSKIMAQGWAPNILQQACTRALVKLQFAYELAVRMMQALNAETPTNVQMAGELLCYHDLTKAAIDASEAAAYDHGDGVWFPDQRALNALRAMLPRWMVRVVDIIKRLGAHNLLATAGQGELADEALRPLLDTYLVGADDLDPEARSRLFRMAWDFAGSALGSRVELYERFYLASSERNLEINHRIAQSAEGWDLLDEFIAGCSDE